MVGDAVSKESVNNYLSRAYTINRAQVESMWQGVKVAYDSSKECNVLRKYVDILPYDDRGLDSVAINIAKELI